jgi:uncharacterized membrane protein YdfJ with MMPL/SSD domain
MSRGRRVRTSVGAPPIPRARVGEPLRAEQQLADDQERPSLTDPIEGAGDAAGLSVTRVAAIVFFASSVRSVFFVKQIAIGMAVGVLIDATIVRALLVPSLMRLFGEWNWWAPAPLRRVQRRFGFSEA